MDFKDLSPTCFAHGGSLRPRGTSGSARSFLSPGPLSDRMETYEPERTPPSEQRGASPERAGGTDGASFDGRSSGEYCALPDILGSMKQVHSTVPGLPMHAAYLLVAGYCAPARREQKMVEFVYPSELVSSARACFCVSLVEYFQHGHTPPCTVGYFFKVRRVGGAGCYSVMALFQPVRSRKESCHVLDVELRKTR